MKEVIRTNDPVLLSFVEAVLRDAGIAAVVLDQNMSVLEGSIGVLPRRVLVSDDDYDEAASLLAEIDGGRAAADEAPHG